MMCPVCGSPLDHTNTCNNEYSDCFRSEYTEEYLSAFWEGYNKALMEAAEDAAGEDL